jgi:hypothetical protein
MLINTSNVFLRAYIVKKKCPKFLQLQRIVSCTVNLGHGADAISYKMVARNHLTVSSDFFPFPSPVTRSPAARPAASLAADSSLPRPAPEWAPLALLLQSQLQYTDLVCFEVVAARAASGWPCFCCIRACTTGRLEWALRIFFLAVSTYSRWIPGFCLASAQIVKSMLTTFFPRAICFDERPTLAQALGETNQASQPTPSSTVYELNPAQSNPFHLKKW